MTHRPVAAALAALAVAALTLAVGPVHAQERDGGGPAIFVTGLTLTSVGTAASMAGAVLWATTDDGAVDQVGKSANDPAHFRKIDGDASQRTVALAMLVAGSLTTAAGVPLLVFGAGRMGSNGERTSELLLRSGGVVYRARF